MFKTLIRWIRKLLGKEPPPGPALPANPDCPPDLPGSVSESWIAGQQAEDAEP